MSFLPADLAASTLTKKLRQLETLYEHVDENAGPGVLDDALAQIDVESLCNSLEAYFLFLKSKPLTSASEERWQTALQFVTEIVQRIGRGAIDQDQQRSISARLKQLELLNGHLHLGRRRRPEQVRSLPSEVIETLYQMLDPESPDNPFRDANSRWRVYVVFMLLLHQGLRIGEILSCPVDVIKTSLDRNRCEHRHWMAVRSNEYGDDDPRHSKPQIKNAQSIRQIPVSKPIALLVTEYVVNYRGRPAHSFLLSSQQKKPLSPEGVSKMFKKISDSLPSQTRRILMDHTGGESISTHDLRHTCAVVRLNQLLCSGFEMANALEQMRPFFGWARSSEMPLRYARTVFEDRLAAVWNSAFDDRIEVIRNLTKRLK